MLSWKTWLLRFCIDPQCTLYWEKCSLVLRVWVICRESFIWGSRKVNWKISVDFSVIFLALYVLTYATPIILIIQRMPGCHYSVPLWWILEGTSFSAITAEGWPYVNVLQRYDTETNIFSVFCKPISQKTYTSPFERSWLRFNTRSLFVFLKLNHFCWNFFGEGLRRAEWRRKRKPFNLSKGLGCERHSPI